MILVHVTFQAMLPLKVKYAERERERLGIFGTKHLCSYILYEKS